MHVDDRDNLRPGWKYSEWERKGVPVRLEIGPRDLAGETAMLKARHDGAKRSVPFAQIAGGVQAELDRIQQDLYRRAGERMAANTHIIDSWDDFTDLYASRDGGFAHCHWCGEGACEAEVQEKTRVTIRNIPLERDRTPGACVHCGKPSPGRVLFAQAY